MLIFMVSVFFSGFLTSLTDAQGINPGTYVGGANFKNILNDQLFWKSIYVTVKLTFVSLVVQIPFSFVLALWIETVPYEKMRSIIKAAFFIPSIMNTIVAGLLFRFLFTGENCILNLLIAPINSLFISIFDSEPVLPSRVDWLQDTDLAFSLVVIVYFWQCVGFQTIYFSAYRNAIDKTIYEAAKIDGASNFAIFRSITVPLMRPAIIFMGITSAVAGLMLYDLLMSLFPHGAHENAKTIIYYIYERSFGYKFELGLSSAAGGITFLIILSVSLLQLKLFGLGRHDDA
jgi:ABC-type sugar transport system permease subunit